MSLYFITGNKNKFEEAKSILPDLKRIDIDLPEIQEIDSHKVVKAKLLEALNHHKGEFIVEDVSFEMEALNGFPGPLVKWMIDSVGVQGLYEVAEKMGNLNAESVATIGYAKNHEEIYFFDGRVKGRLVPETGSKGFAFDKIFIPKGHTKRYSEMKPEEKNKISHRRLALDKLKEFLETNK